MTLFLSIGIYTHKFLQCISLYNLKLTLLDNAIPLCLLYEQNKLTDDIK